jgi:restriction system protein
MAEITVRRRGELVRSVFRVLLERPDGLPARDVLERLRSAIPPTPFEDSEYPNRPGVRRYDKIVRFSTIPVVKAGWLTKEKGQWALSDAGRAAFERYRDPEEFEREARRLYRQWEELQAPETEEEAASAAPTAAATLEEAEETAWQEIQDRTCASRVA